MPPGFGSYQTLSRGGWMWFLTGGMNCTSFAQWVSGQQQAGQILACPHGLAMAQTQQTSFPPVDYGGGVKRKTRGRKHRKHRKRTKHRRRHRKRTRHNKKKRKRRKRTRR